MFKEANGQVSMMRVLSLLSVLCACIIGLYGAKLGHDVTGLCGVFLAAGFGGKLGQKALESGQVLGQQDVLGQKEQQ